MTSVLSRLPDDLASLPTPVHDGPWDARLFGSFRLLGPDGADATPNGRKARALLAYLVLSHGANVPRERLCALLWSERGDDQARASLRQTLYEMRALSGGDAPLLVVDRTGAQVPPARIASDRLRIRAAAEAGDALALAALVGDRPAELLADLDGLDPAFDEWLAAERVRQDGDRRRSMLAVAGHAIASGDAVVAYRLATALLACDTTDEAAARIAMEASHRDGDRDAARRIFAQLRDALRVELGAAPADETVALHERLMTSELPMRAAVTARATTDDARRSAAPDAAAMPPSAVVAAGNAEAEPPSRSPRRLGRVVLGVACAIVVVAGAVAGWSLRPTAPAATPRTLVVRPLAAAQDDAPALALRTGLSADLARLLVGNADTLQVVDASQVPNEPSRSTFTVDGEARSDGGRLHATIRLSQGRDGPILWSETFARGVGDVAGLREEIASTIDDVAVCALGPTNPDALRFEAEAMRLVLTICEQSHRKASAETIKLLERLLTLEPRYARGWSLLAVERQYVAFDLPGDAAAIRAEAERDAQHALALDPRDGEAYYARAIGLEGIDRWQDRMDVLSRGHAVDPANGDLDSAIAEDLARVGRWHEAAVFNQRAVDADPFSAYAAAGRIRLLAFDGDRNDANDAIEALAAARERFGKHRAIASADFEVNALVGDPRRALAILDDPDRGFALRPERVELWRTLIAGRAAPSPESQARVERFLRGAVRTSPLEVMLVLQTLGRENRVDEAYAFIDGLGPDLREPLPTEVLFSVLTRSVRDDPRFMTVAARAGLVELWQATDRWPDFCTDAAARYDCRAEAARARSTTARPLVSR